MENKNYKYIIGIDLGTSNTVVSYALINDPEEVPEFKIFEIPQIVKPGEILTRPALPSFIYFPDDNEKGRDKFSLPWSDDETFIIGEFARKRGGEIPSRQIASAKSWLCNVHVKREDDILPWNSEEVNEKFSPVRAQTEILNHIKEAWNFEFALDDEDSSFEEQNILITIPASFDAVARELTLQACKKAGIKNLTLMEEPQAAFYSWLKDNDDTWRDEIEKEDLILVCDIGGGTSDFTLIKVNDEGGNLELERSAVGNHLLVGGDNMDLALSYLVNSKFAASGKKLDQWQMKSLVNKSREAKEYLFENFNADSARVTLLGKGSKLIGGTLKSDIKKAELEQIVKAGFFPMCKKEDLPQNNQKTGLMEVGLSYESDPAITKHLADFLSGNDEDKTPSYILFNGGVMKSEEIRGHIRSVVSSWSQENQAKELKNITPDTAVAKGAAYYGFIKESGGIRIKSGLNKTYYIEVASSMPAIPGIPVPTKAVCVAPFGTEEGSILKIDENQYMLTLGENVSFNLLESSKNRNDETGETIEDFQGNLEQVTEIETFLQGEKGDQIPVILEIHATEVGTLDFYCASVNDDRKWKLEFNLRQTD
jgi:molecular chaperone DnaK (HSP70)